MEAGQPNKQSAHSNHDRSYTLHSITTTKEDHHAHWPEYPPRSAAQLAHVLRMVQANAKPIGDWRTPFEREEPTEAIIHYEQRQLAASLAYLQMVPETSHHP